MRDWICSHSKRHANVSGFSDRKILCMQTAQSDLELQFAMSNRIFCISSIGAGSSDSPWMHGVDTGFNIGDDAGGSSDSGVVAGGDNVYAGSEVTGSKLGDD